MNADTTKVKIHRVGSGYVVESKSELTYCPNPETAIQIAKLMSKWR